MYSKFNLSFVTFLVILLLLSGCEKTEPKPDKLHSEVDSSHNEEFSEPVLHMTFKEGVSEEEQTNQWKAEVRKQQEKIGTQRTSATEEKNMFLQIKTVTGSKKYDNTDSRIMAWVFIKKDGVKGVLTYYLNNPGDDREKGQTDLYLFYSAQKFNRSLEFTKFILEMDGSDGWGIEYFQALATAEMQEPGYPYIDCNSSVSTNGSNNNSCRYTGYTAVRHYGHVFIDLDDSKYLSEVSSNYQEGIITVRQTGL